MAIENIERSHLIQFNPSSSEVTKTLMWPSFEYYRTAKYVELKRAKINKVEWYASDYIKSLRFTMFDGTFSPILGSRPPT